MLPAELISASEYASFWMQQWQNWNEMSLHKQQFIEKFVHIAIVQSFEIKQPFCKNLKTYVLFSIVMKCIHGIRVHTNIFHNQTHKHVHTGTHMHADIGMDTRIMYVKQKSNKRWSTLKCHTMVIEEWEISTGLTICHNCLKQNLFVNFQHLKLSLN